ncbi:hypothetical protein, partial [Escherichia coli]|uniref:hypothetical protein n=1 Tax=Escherichia coli TaxID=562 RepID=UPI001BC8C015
SLQGKISSDGCLKKEQMVVSAIASTPHSASAGDQVAAFNISRKRSKNLAFYRGKRISTITYNICESLSNWKQSV